jgi:hypothetical protein
MATLKVMESRKLVLLAAAVALALSMVGYAAG